ncbi:hypothetical protein [Bradyrhizobium sp. DASA03007]|uniref:hypothetical protein n=1 Tax=unclassified Bradyrhizobium TaxID=2631580 RepID=UPI003F724FC5
MKCFSRWDKGQKFEFESMVPVADAGSLKIGAVAVSHGATDQLPVVRDDQTYRTTRSRVVLTPAFNTIAIGANVAYR